MPISIVSEELEQSTQTKKSTGVDSFSYPSTLESEADNRHNSYLIFNAVQPITDGYNMTAGSLRNRRNQYLKTSNSQNRSGMKESTLAYIQMYMPAVIENFMHNYDQSNSNFIADIASIIQNAGGNETLMESFKETGSELLGTVVSGVQQLMQNAVGETVVRTSGVLRGQRQAGLYAGTSLRNHHFFFQLRPKDLTELKNVANIIKSFQKYSSAKLLNEDADYNSFNTVEVPPIWYIEERQRNPNSPRYIPKFSFGPAVIVDVKVNKTPDQIYASFKSTGGDPIAIDLEIQFQELVPVFQDYWNAVHGDLS